MDKASLRAKLCVDLHKLGTSNPSLRGKLDFPELEINALMSLIVLICPNGINGGLKVRSCNLTKILVYLGLLSIY